MSYVLSFSGGIDSTSLLLKLISQKKDIYALTFDYGQKHSIEIQFAKKNISYLSKRGFNIKHQIINISDLVNILESSLTNNSIEVPEGHYLDENMKSTFVPNRNAIFSSIIYAYAISIYKRTKNQVTLSLGVHSGDHEIYPDCRPDFYKQIMESFKIGNWDSENIDIYLPYININKSDIIKDGIKSCEMLGIDYKSIYKNTLTTYFPNKDGASNGKTGSDIERILSFYNIGIEDPGLYTKPWKELLKYAQESEKSINS
tara:strand:+ start:691 stop:1464 length:774 start_codon:yes stop_codon:yes gene_type:complete